MTLMTVFVVVLTVLVVVISQVLAANARYHEPLESSIKVEMSREKIKLKLVSGQILVGNRKIVHLNREKVQSGTGGQTFYKKNREERIVYEFLGIPFAQTPLDERRFKFPQRLNDILPTQKYNATYYRPSCYQEYDLTFPNFRGSEMWNAPHGVSEDCLYFNMWVPVNRDQDHLLYQIETLENLNTEWRINYIQNPFKSNTKALKASLFWVYGGSFNSGSANLNITDGTLLAALENVILVTFNYRVGPFGFLYLNNSQAPGNAGLMDQVMVVEWYREHYMRYLGADEDAICLFGESAGAMSLHYLMLTNKAHLFKRLIFQSSSSYSDLTYRPPQDAYRISLRLAERLQCLFVKIDNSTTNRTDETPLNIRQNRMKPVDTSISYNQLPKLDEFNAELAKCLMNVNAGDLSLLQYEIDYVNDYLKMQFIPTLDYHGLITIDPNEVDFKTASDEIKARLNHDILVGINKDEGTYFTFYLYNTLYFNLNGFLSPNNTKYDNKFVFDRLKEAFRHRYPSSLYDEHHLRVHSLHYNPVPAQSHKISVLTLKLLGQAPTVIKTSSTVEEYFYEQFVNCLGNMYKNRNPSLIKGDVNLFDLETNTQNKPENAWNKFNKIIGDYVFSCPTIKLAANYSQLNPNRTFFYRFNKRSKENPWPAWTGVLHGYEIEYIFGVPWLQEGYFDLDDRRVSRRIMSYWANFAKYGRLHSDMDENQRRFLVQFSPNGTLDEGEQTEYELINRMYENCGYMGQLNRHQTYATKYEMCMNYQGHVVDKNQANEVTFRSHSLVMVSSLIFRTFVVGFFWLGG